MIVLTALAYSLAVTFVRESGKIIVARAFKDIRGRINKNKLEKYIEGEISNVKSLDLVGTATDAAMGNEALRTCVMDMLLCLIPVRSNPLDMVEVPELSPEDQAIVRKDLDMIIPEMREILWSENRFQKNIFTGGPEFQRVVAYSIRELSKQANSLFSDLHQYIDDLCEDIDRKTACSIPESFERPAMEMCWGDDIVNEIQKSLSEKNSVLVSGAPGSGKTELCRRGVTEFCIRNGCKPVWMEYKGDMASTLEKGIRLPEWYEGTVIDALSRERNLLIVIDGCSLENDDMRELERIRNGCKRIYITRHKAIPGRMRCVNVRRPTETEAMSIFEAHSNVGTMEGEHRSILAKVLESYDFNPEVASIMGELSDSIGFDELQYGLASHFEESVTLCKDNKAECSSVGSFLNAMYPLKDREDEFVKTITAVWFEENVQQERLNELVRTGWIVKETKNSASTYRISRVLSEILDNRYLLED